MEKALKYEVIDAESIDLLVETVQRRISDGWQPLSGPFYLNGSFFQAVVLPEEPSSRVEAISHRRGIRQSEIELIEELTEDDEPISPWEERVEDGTQG